MWNKGMAWLRKAALGVISNECLFMFANFLVIGVLTMGPLRWHQEAVNMFDRYILIPWGVALCALRIERNSKRLDMPRRLDLDILFVLALWIVVPFGLRFGLTFNNVGSWHGFIVAYFGIYAMTSEEPTEKRDQLLDLAAVLFGLLSLVLGAAALYCALYAAEFGKGVSEFTFGVAKDGMLRIGQHHNTTGMIAMLCALMCLTGMSRSKRLVMKLGYVLGAGLMSVLVVLSQSRTSRYSLLAALALAAYGALACGRWHKGALVRHGAGMLAAAVILVGGYAGASVMTDAALEHYAYARAGVKKEASVSLIASAAAEQTEKKETSAAGGETAKKAPAKKVKVVDARGAGDASFTGRTLIWKNLFKIWKENPKHFLIGQGVGRTGSRVVEGTLLEKEGAATMHNTFLQFAADYGLIGLALLCAFLVLLVMPCLRVFFARGEAVMPGGRMLCALVVACLMTGMMESDPFASMRFCNITLLFAFAMIMGRSRDMQSLV